MAKQVRDDDSAEAVKLDLDDAKQRLLNIETALTNPEQLGNLLAPAVKNSSILRKELIGVLLELMDDYDTRKEFKKIVAKIDRENIIRWGKYLAGFLVWLATIVGAIFAYVAISH